jgi:hypothetical protein
VADGRAPARPRWFIAFAPADKPVIALAVLVENGGFGAQSAAPIARQVLDYYLLGKLPAGIAPKIRRRGVGDSAGDDPASTPAAGCTICWRPSTGR